LVIFKTPTQAFKVGRLLRKMKPDQVRAIPLEPVNTIGEVKELVEQSGLGANRFRLPVSLRLALNQ
jgi:hypothetical protein